MHIVHKQFSQVVHYKSTYLYAFFLPVLDHSIVTPHCHFPLIASSKKLFYSVSQYITWPLWSYAKKCLLNSDLIFSSLDFIAIKS